MLYCFNSKNIPNNDRANDEIKYAIKMGCFIYYDNEKDLFFDENDQEVKITNQKVMPSSFIFQLPQMIEALERNHAIIPNTMDEIKMVQEWYKYIEPKRLIVPFKGKHIEDKEFLNYICYVFKKNPEVFLKTKDKDFSGLIDLEDLVNEESDLRKALKYHEEKKFILSEKVEINADEIGNEEYRAIIHNKRIMNISRITDSTYHKIPSDLIDYIEELLISLPSYFPKTFVLDIFSYQHMYDILECNPLEASGKYLYNSIFSFSEDLLHNDITNVPEEHKNRELSYENNENLVASTLTSVQGTFAKDYDDIKKYNQRIEGFIHIEGLQPGSKIDINELFDSIELFSDSSLTEQPEKKKSLTPKNV